jgi:hypothetical protein
MFNYLKSFFHPAPDPVPDHFVSYCAILSVIQDKGTSAEMIQDQEIYDRIPINAADVNSAIKKIRKLYPKNTIIKINHFIKIES